jgi:flagellar basal-body rod protein FlgB
MFSTPTDVVVRGALDGLAARHRVYANNLANVETPGFQPADVPFEAELRRVRDTLYRNPAGEPQPARARLTPVPTDQGAGRPDANGVQTDEQMIRLAENTLSYEALAQAARMRGELLRSVISEGRR